jgi:uncharacterized protein YjbI with pentapeptide repeats
MDRSEALALLRGGPLGAKRWNERRDQDGGPPSLEAADLRFAYLCGADLTEVDLTDARLEHALLLRANLAEARLGGASLIGADLSQADALGADFTGANLNKATLHRARMMSCFLYGASLEAAEGVGIDLSESDCNQASLQDAVFPVADFEGADLTDADLSGAILTDARFRGVDCSSATLSGADLAGADLRQAAFGSLDLDGVCFHDADLKDAKLAKASGLATSQFCGACVSGAELPAGIKDFKALETLKDAASNARTIFLALLLACAYCLLTLGTTDDSLLLTNASSSNLPIVAVPVPIVGFYWVAPLLLLSVGLYFQLCMQAIWERLRDLPSQLPDGRMLHRASDPWLLLGLSEAHFALLREERSLSSRLQEILSVLLCWWAIPLTLLSLWFRYLRRHEPLGTGWQSIILLLSIVLAVFSYRLAKETLRGEKAPNRLTRTTRAANSRSPSDTSRSSKPVKRKRKIPWSLVALCGVAAVAVIGFAWGIAFPGSGLDQGAFRTNANLRGATVSMRPERWRGDRQQLEEVGRANLADRNLRGLQAQGAFLVRARLDHADLTGADLSSADLWQASFEDTDMASAVLNSARLWQVDLRAARNLDARSLRRACLDGGTRLPAALAGTAYPPSGECERLWGPVLPD